MMSIMTTAESFKEKQLDTFYTKKPDGQGCVGPDVPSSDLHISSGCTLYMQRV